MNHKHPEAFDQFAILEIIGHRRLGGRVREATIGGIPLIRIDVFRDGDEPPATQYYGPSAIFCLTPATEEAAQAASTFVPPLEEYKIDGKANAQVVEALDKAVAALRGVEWSATTDSGEPVCPLCRYDETVGHYEGCLIGAVLADDEIPF